MPRVISCIVKNWIDDRWLSDKMLQMTVANQKHFVNDRYPIHIIDDYNDIFNFLDEADYIYVCTGGDLIIDEELVWENLQNIPDDVGLIGHIMWYPGDTTPHLHKQCFIVKTSALKKTQKSFYKKKKVGKLFFRSDEDMHNGQAPLYIGLTKETGNRQDGFGTVVMEAVLIQNLKVVNFDKNWRTTRSLKITLPEMFRNQDEALHSRGYLYPENNSQSFSKSLRGLFLSKDLDPAQANIVRLAKEFVKFNWINVLHYDDMIEGVPSDTIICPASGLQGESLALVNGAKKIVFYDINENNIRFKKYMYETFDGQNYEEFYKKYAEKNNLKIEPSTSLEVFNSQKNNDYNLEVFKNWQNVKNYKKTFMIGDIFDIIDYLLNQMEGRTLFVTSTILGNYILTNLFRSEEEIEKLKKKIYYAMQRTDSYWYFN